MYSYVLKDGKNQIVIEDNNKVFNATEIDGFKKRFNEIKNSGKVPVGDFSDFNWAFTNDNGEIANLQLSIHKFPQINIILKCLAIILVEKGMSAKTLQAYFYLLKKALILSECFSVSKVNDFEDYLYECTDSQIKRIVTIVPWFLAFSGLEEADDYLEVCDRMECQNNAIRRIPDYKSILIFNHEINNAIWTDKNDKKLKWYPLFLWWRITGVIPLRPSEFLGLEYNCCYRDSNSRYWLTVPRKKVKQSTSKSQIEIVDTLEVTEDVFNFIDEYKSMLKPEFKSDYLISYKAYNYFSKRDGKKSKKNPEIMKLNSIRLLLNQFYVEKIADETVIPLKPGDSRHLAFCNMILQGFNPISIARMGGHTKLQSQMHYHQHLDTFAESFIFTMADKLKIMYHLKTRNSSGKYEVLNRGKLLGTFSSVEVSNFLEIDKGYCTVKSKDSYDFSNCEKDCWFCQFHILDINKFPEAINELTVRSDKLGVVIKEQIELLKAISKNMFIDYSQEKCAFEGTSRLKSTAEQLKGIMADKIIIDSKLLDYIKGE